MSRLAFNMNMDSVFAAPREIDEKDRAHTARILTAILGKDETVIINKLRCKKGFIWIDRKIPDGLAQKIKSAKLKGIAIVKESKRFYPNAYLASHIIGFAGLDNSGLEGLELVYDKYLKGKSGLRLTNRDGKRRFLASNDERYQAPVNGFNLILNVDATIQNIAEEALDEAYKKYHAKGATIIVMDPSNGEVLALANRPTYNLNSFDLSNSESRRNRAITDSFEPGSVFKIVTASCALEKKAVTFQDRFNCENGKFWIAGHVLHDHEPYGILTFREVIEKSSNIGTVKVAQRLAPADLYSYVRSFGFGQNTGIDLRGEVGGVTHPPSRWSKATISALPIGQEVTVTAMQLACAMSAIANGGVCVRPWVVREIRDEQGEAVVTFAPKALRRAITQETSAQMRGLLQGVVERGTGNFAKLESYTAGGKTGTAQKVDPSGLYSHSRFVASFVGFAPVGNPKIVVAVCIDEPHPLYYGGLVSAPAFKKTAESTLRYLGVPPDVQNTKPLKVVLNGPGAALAD